MVVRLLRGQLQNKLIVNPIYAKRGQNGNNSNRLYQSLPFLLGNITVLVRVLKGQLQHNLMVNHIIQERAKWI